MLNDYITALRLNPYMVDAIMARAANSDMSTADYEKLEQIAERI